MTKRTQIVRQMLTVQQVAEVLNTCTKTVRRRIDSGAMPHHRFGDQVRVSQDDLNSYIAKARR